VNHVDRVRPAASAALLALVLTVVAGCTSNSNGKGGPSASAPAEGLSRAQAQGALLTASEVGGGMSQTGNDTSQTPFPCTPAEPPLDKRVKPQVKVESTFADPNDQQEFTEEIANYGNEAGVTKALSLGEKGLACHNGSVRTKTGSVSVAIGGPLDLAKSITTQVDKVEGWSIASTTARQTLVVARVGTQLVVLTFATVGGSTPDTTNTAAVIEKALAKVRKATG
jgi:hypothetical protein